MTEGGWPDPGSDADRQKAVFNAKVAAAQEHAKAVDARVQKDVDAELELHGEFHKAIFEVAKNSIERARASADTVQKASSAILAIYTAILGVVFSVSDNPLPSRGVIPALFLGLAVVFSTAYLAYLTVPPSTPAPRPTGQLRPASLERARVFIRWTASTVRNRAYWLRAGVVALGVSLMFLPAPFLGPLPGLDRINPASEATPASLEPAWPPIPAGSADDIELRKIVYQAQVDEIAAERKASRPDEVEADRSWWIASIGGFLVVFLMPLVVRSRAVSQTDGQALPAAERA